MSVVGQDCTRQLSDIRHLTSDYWVVILNLFDRTYSIRLSGIQVRPLTLTVRQIRVS